MQRSKQHQCSKTHSQLIQFRYHKAPDSAKPNCISVSKCIRAVYREGLIMKQLLVLLSSIVCLANSEVLQVILVDSSSSCYEETAATTSQEINNCSWLLNGTIQVKTVSSQFPSSVVEVANLPGRPIISKYTCNTIASACSCRASREKVM